MKGLDRCPFCGCNSITTEIDFSSREFRIYCMSGMDGEDCLAEMRLSFDEAGIIGDSIDFEKAHKIMGKMIDAWNRREK